MDESAILQALFESDDELDLDAGIMRALAEADAGSTTITDAEIERQMREHLGLSKLDVSGTLSAAPNAGVAIVRPSDDDRDDYNEYEWKIVLSMRNHCMRAIRPETSHKARHAALRWLFVRGEEDSQGIAFHLACEALQARPWVIQALIHHYFAIRDIHLEGGLPQGSDELPDALESEAMFHGWLAGIEVAKALWRLPGLLESELVAMTSLDDDGCHRALACLIDAGLASMRVSRAYLTSRPGAIRGSGSGLSWSRSFLGD